MNYRYPPSSPSLLDDILRRNPSATLQEIRRSHPSFRAMSWDHLSITLDRALESARLR